MKYLYLIALLLLLIVFAVFLYLCLRKTDQVKLQPWTGDQLRDVMAIIKPLLPVDIDQHSVECLVSDLSRKMSFKDFKAKNSNQQYESLFGVKGRWANCMKQNMIAAFMKMTNNGPCSLCIIGTLEQTYSPFDFNHKNDADLKTILEKIMISCDVCKN